jgi:hypothetical protein
MKDPSWVSWDPLLHWTDQKIRVHAFYCFTALLISSLLKHLQETVPGNRDQGSLQRPAARSETGTGYRAKPER